MEKIYRQIERFKGRRWRSRGDGRSAADFASDHENEAAETVDLGETIVRRKRLPLSPMDEREAVEQMGLLSHEDFFHQPHGRPV
jgi:putative sigma-54 modulation protein